MGMTPDQIHEDMDAPLPSVWAELTLDFANKHWFDALLAAEQAEADELYGEWLREQPAISAQAQYRDGNGASGAAA